MWLYLPISASLPGPADLISPCDWLCQQLTASAMWRSSFRQPPFWRRALRTVPWMRLLSGLTYERSRQDSIVAAWLEQFSVSPARISLSQVSRPVWQKGLEVDCSTTPCASFARLDASGCSSKMCVICSRNLPESLVAYAAGIVDGEGSLGISSQTTNGRSRYWPILSIKMAKPHSLNVMRSLFGGEVRPVQRKNNPQDAATLSWVLNGAQLLCPLLKMHQHLHMKRNQAEVIISMLQREWPLSKNQRGIEWTPSVSEEWETAKQRLHFLNQKGSALEPGAIAQLVGGQWMTTQRDLFGERWVPFSESFPESGCLRNGVVYERPTSALRTGGSESSSWPTARAEDSECCGNHAGAQDSLGGGE